MNSRRAGFTIVELLVGVAVFGLILTGIYAVLIANTKTYQSEENSRIQTQDLRAGLATMVWELRMTGYDPGQSAGASILVADTATLQFQMDLDGDGAMIDAASDEGEQVRYTLTNDADGDGVADGGGTGSLRRQVWAEAVVNPVVTNVTNLNFTYFDGTNTQLTPVPLNATNRAAVRAVQVTVTSRMAEPDPVSGRREQMTHTTRVWMRNMGLQ